MVSKGIIKLTVDQDGNARLTGIAGLIVFNGTPVLDKIGTKIKNFSVTFNNEGDMKVGYTATIDLKIKVMTVVGKFDLDALITSCSGLLCRAAKLLKGRHQGYEMELQKIMGK